MTEDVKKEVELEEPEADAPQREVLIMASPLTIEQRVEVLEKKLQEMYDSTNMLVTAYNKLVEAELRRKEKDGAMKRVLDKFLALAPKETADVDPKAE